MRKITLMVVMLLTYVSTMQAQFTESFDTEIPSDWTVINNDGQDNTWEHYDESSGSYEAYQGTGTARITYESGPHDDYLISPQFTVTDEVSDLIVFYASGTGDTFPESFDVKISTTGVNVSDFTETLGSEVTSDDAEDGEYSEYSYDLSDYEGDDVYIAIVATSTNEFYLFVDEFSVTTPPSCLQLTNLIAENETSDSVDLSWDEEPNASEGYNWYVFEAGADPDTDTPIADGNTTDEEVTVTDLDSATNYEVYVEADCDADGISDLSEAVSFTTYGTCGDAVTHCYEDNGDLVGTYTVENPGDWITVTFNGGETENCCDDLIVYEGAGTSGTELYSEAGDQTGTEVTSETGTLTVYVDSDGGLSCSSGSYDELDFTITCSPPPSCLVPDNLVVSDITAYEADLSWDEEPNASEGYNWYVFEAGADPDTDTPVADGNTTDEEVSVTGLDPETEYEAYVEADCDTDGISELSDPVNFETEVSCPVPENLSVSNTTDQETNLSWDEEPNASEGYNWYVFEAGADPDTDTPVADGNTTDEEVSITGLDPETEYEAYLEADCGNTDGMSDLTDPLSFSTTITPVIVSTSDSVEDETYCYENDDFKEWLFEAENGEVMTITFQDGTLEETPSGTTYDDLVIYDGNDDSGTVLFDSDSEGGELADLTFEATSGYIYMTLDSDGGTSCDDGDETEIDFDVIITPCPTPENLQVSDVTTDEAILGWGETASSTNGYNWYVFEAGADPDTDTPVADGNTTDEEITVTGLDSATNYEVYVEADCDTDGLSELSNAVSFTTTCAVANIPTTLEEFEDATSNYNTNENMVCWTEGSGELTTSTTVTESNSGWSSGNYNNDSENINGTAAFINLYNSLGSQDWLISPSIDLNSVTEDTEVRFDVSVIPWSGNDPVTSMGDHSVQVVISTDNGQTWSDANILETYDSSNIPDSGYTETIALSGYSGNIKIGFYAIQDGITPDLRFYIDNFQVRIPPTCPEPTGLTIENITTDEADFSWDEEPDASEGYHWYIFEGGADPDTDTPVDDNTTTDEEVNITGLDPETEYDVYVLSDCDSLGESNLEGPVSFTTLAVPPVNDNLADAIALTIDATCTGDNYTNENATTQTDEPAGSCGFLGDGVQASVWFTFEAPAGGKVIITTDILPGDLDDSQIAVFPEPTDVDDLSTLPGEIGCDEDSGDVNVPSGLMSYLELDGLTAGDTYYIQVDGYDGEEGGFCIEVQLPPCEDPSDIMISNETSESAEVSWTENGDATEWEILYGEAGFDPSTEGESITDDDGTLGETIEDLDPDTEYDVYVRALCTDNMSDWAGPETFTTELPPCEDPSDIVISNETSESAEVSWTENGDATEWEILYGEAGFDPSTEGESITDDDGTLGETIESLNPDTEYDVYVRALCTDNMSDWAGPETFTTELPPCEDPSDIVISNEEPESADISWTENGDATEWEILYGETGFDPSTGGESITDNDGTLGETIEGLDPETEYDVYVRALCADNMSDWAGPETFMTLPLSVESENFQSFTYHPNPVEGRLFMQANMTIDEMTIYNLLGQEVKTKSFNSLEAEVDLSNLSSGAYLMTVTINGAEKTFRIIKE